MKKGKQILHKVRGILEGMHIEEWKSNDPKKANNDFEKIS